MLFALGSGGAIAHYLTTSLGRTVHNLCGGLIHYFNRGGELVNPEGEIVDMLHPGSRKLAGYIERRNQIKLSDLKET